MDARAVAIAAGVDVLTLNTWVSRGQIPGMKIGARGRRRDFDVETATKVAVIAQLTKIGLGAPQAASIVANLKAPFYKRLLIVIDETQARIDLVQGRRSPPPLLFFDYSSDDTLQTIQNMLEQPTLFVIVDVATLEQRMRKAQEIWDHGIR